jgi:hypothetical protein
VLDEDAFLAVLPEVSDPVHGATQWTVYDLGDAETVEVEGH